MQYFHKDIESMKKFWFTNIVIYTYKVLKFIGLTDKIKFIGLDNIDSKKNIITMNHTSIFDNFLIGLISFNSNYTWNDFNSISRKSRNIQNKVMEIHGNLLVDRDINQDINQFKFKSIFEKWSIKKILNIIIFPEGTVYKPNNDLSTEEKFCLKKSNIEKEFNNLLYPKTGIFNVIMKNMFDELEFLYDITTIYKINNKRLYGNELKILYNLFHPDFKLYINIEKYSLKNNTIKIKDNIFKIKIGEIIDEELLDEFYNILSKKPKIIIIVQHNSEIFNKGLSDSLSKDIFYKFISSLLNFDGILITKIKGSVINEGIIFPLLSNINYAYDNLSITFDNFIKDDFYYSLLKKKINIHQISYYKLTNQKLNIQEALNLGFINEIHSSNKWNDLINNLDKIIFNHNNI